MKFRFTALMFAVACWAALASAALAQTPNNPSDQSNSHQVQSAASNASGNAATSMNANQRAADLINTANQDEIAEGQMMQDHSQNPQVQDLAKTIVTDHTQAEDKLKDIASSGNITLSTNSAMHDKDQSELDKLKNEPSKRADRAFASSEVRAHRMVIARLRRLEPKVTDQSLKSYIKQTIPVLRKHERMARRLVASLGGKSASGTPAAKAHRTYQ
jgi:putative membrane protein